MIVCPACGHQNVPAVYFCVECAELLPKPDMLSPEGETAWLDSLTDDNAFGLYQTPEALWLILQPDMFFNNRKRLVNGQLLLGRAERARDFTILNLETEGIDHLGVSRLHAALLPLEHGIGLQDLGSTNGTRLNGQEVASGHIYNLTHRDRLELGKLGMQVHFIKLDVFLKGIREMLVKQFEPDVQEVLAGVVIPTEALVVLLQRLPKMTDEQYQILTLFQERREPVTLEKLHQRINRVLGDRGYQGSLDGTAAEGPPTLEIRRGMFDNINLDHLDQTEVLIPHYQQILNDLRADGELMADKLREYVERVELITDEVEREEALRLVMLLLTQIEEWLPRIEAAKSSG